MNENKVPFRNEPEQYREFEIIKQDSGTSMMIGQYYVLFDQECYLHHDGTLHKTAGDSGWFKNYKQIGHALIKYHEEQARENNG